MAHLSYIARLSNSASSLNKRPCMKRDDGDFLECLTNCLVRDPDVMRKLCLKICKRCRGSKCRETYAVFDGGNSLNVALCKKTSNDCSHFKCNNNEHTKGRLAGLNIDEGKTYKNPKYINKEQSNDISAKSKDKLNNEYMSTTQNKHLTNDDLHTQDYSKKHRKYRDSERRTIDNYKNNENAEHWKQSGQLRKTDSDIKKKGSKTDLKNQVDLPESLKTRVDLQSKESKRRSRDIDKRSENANHIQQNQKLNKTNNDINKTRSTNDLKNQVDLQGGLETHVDQQSKKIKRRSRDIDKSSENANHIQQNQKLKKTNNNINKNQVDLPESLKTHVDLQSKEGKRRSRDIEKSSENANHFQQNQKLKKTNNDINKKRSKNDLKNQVDLPESFNALVDLQSKESKRRSRDIDKSSENADHFQQNQKLKTTENGKNIQSDGKKRLRRRMRRMSESKIASNQAQNHTRADEAKTCDLLRAQMELRDQRNYLDCRSQKSQNLPLSYSYSERCCCCTNEICSGFYTSSKHPYECCVNI